MKASTHYQQHQLKIRKVFNLKKVKIDIFIFFHLFIFICSSTDSQYIRGNSFSYWIDLGIPSFVRSRQSELQSIFQFVSNNVQPCTNK